MRCHSELENAFARKTGSRVYLPRRLQPTSGMHSGLFGNVSQSLGFAIRIECGHHPGNLLASTIAPGSMHQICRFPTIFRQFCCKPIKDGIPSLKAESCLQTSLLNQADTRPIGAESNLRSTRDN